MNRYRLRILIPAIALLLSGSTAWGAEINWYYTYGGFESVVMALNNMALMLNSPAYRSLFAVFAIIGLVFSGLANYARLASGKGGSPLMWVVNPMFGIIMTYVLFFSGSWNNGITEGKLHIRDDVLNRDAEVSGLPDMYVLMLGGLSGIQYDVVNLISESAISTSYQTTYDLGGYSQSAGGIGFDAILGLAKAPIKLNDSYLTANYERYVKDCFFFAISTPGNNIDLKAVRLSPDMTTELAKAAYPSITTVIYSDTNNTGTTVTCAAAWTEVQKSFESTEFKKITKDFREIQCAAAGYDPTAAGAMERCEDNMNNLIKMATDGGGSTSGCATEGTVDNLTKQRILAETMNNVVLYGSTDTAISIIANRSAGTSMLAAGVTANSWVPIIQGTITAIAIGITPFLFIFLATPLFPQALSIIVGFFVWLTAWGVCDAVVHNFGMQFARYAFHEARTNCLSYDTIMTFGTNAMKSLAAFGAMRWSGMMLATVISTMLVKFGGSIMGQLSGQITGAVQGAAGAGAVAATPEGRASFLSSMQSAPATLSNAEKFSFRDRAAIQETGMLSQTMVGKAQLDAFGGSGSNRAEVAATTMAKPQIVNSISSIQGENNAIDGAGGVAKATAAKTSMATFQSAQVYSSAQQFHASTGGDIGTSLNLGQETGKMQGARTATGAKETIALVKAGGHTMDKAGNLLGGKDAMQVNSQVEEAQSFANKGILNKDGSTNENTSKFTTRLGQSAAMNLMSQANNMDIVAKDGGKNKTREEEDAHLADTAQQLGAAGAAQTIKTAKGVRKEKKEYAAKNRIKDENDNVGYANATAEIASDDAINTAHTNMAMMESKEADPGNYHTSRAHDGRVAGHAAVGKFKAKLDASMGHEQKKVNEAEGERMANGTAAEQAAYKEAKKEVDAATRNAPTREQLDQAEANLLASNGEKSHKNHKKAVDLKKKIAAGDENSKETKAAQADLDQLVADEVKTNPSAYASKSEIGRKAVEKMQATDKNYQAPQATWESAAKSLGTEQGKQAGGEEVGATMGKASVMKNLGAEAKGGAFNYGYGDVAYHNAQNQYLGQVGQAQRFAEITGQRMMSSTTASLLNVREGANAVKNVTAEKTDEKKFEQPTTATGKTGKTGTTKQAAGDNAAEQTTAPSSKGKKKGKKDSSPEESSGSGSKSKLGGMGKDEKNSGSDGWRQRDSFGHSFTSIAAAHGMGFQANMDKMFAQMQGFAIQGKTDAQSISHTNQMMGMRETAKGIQSFDEYTRAKEKAGMSESTLAQRTGGNVSMNLTDREAERLRGVKGAKGGSASFSEVEDSRGNRERKNWQSSDSDSHKSSKGDSANIVVDAKVIGEMRQSLQQGAQQAFAAGNKDLGNRLMQQADELKVGDTLNMTGTAAMARLSTAARTGAGSSSSDTFGKRRHDTLDSTEKGSSYTDHVQDNKQVGGSITIPGTNQKASGSMFLGADRKTPVGYQLTEQGLGDLKKYDANFVSTDGVSGPAVVSSTNKLTPTEGKSMPIVPGNTAGNLWDSHSDLTPAQRQVAAAQIQQQWKSGVQSTEVSGSASSGTTFNTVTAAGGRGYHNVGAKLSSDAESAASIRSQTGFIVESNSAYTNNNKVSRETTAGAGMAYMLDKDNVADYQMLGTGNIYNYDAGTLALDQYLRTEANVNTGGAMLRNVRSIGKGAGGGNTPSSSPPPPNSSGGGWKAAGRNALKRKP